MERISIWKIAPTESEHDRNRNTPKLLYAYLKHGVKNVYSVGQYSTDWMNLTQYKQGDCDPVSVFILYYFWVTGLKQLLCGGFYPLMRSKCTRYCINATLTPR